MRPPGTALPRSCACGPVAALLCLLVIAAVVDSAGAAALAVNDDSNAADTSLASQQESSQEEKEERELEASLPDLYQHTAGSGKNHGARRAGIATPVSSSYFGFSALQVAEGSSLSARAENAAAAAAAVPVPENIAEVTHKKDPGHGYDPGSPLYDRQQELRSRPRAQNERADTSRDTAEGGPEAEEEEEDTYTEAVYDYASDTVTVAPSTATKIRHPRSSFSIALYCLFMGLFCLILTAGAHLIHRRHLSRLDTLHHQATFTYEVSKGFRPPSSGSLRSVPLPPPHPGGGPLGSTPPFGSGTISPAARGPDRATSSQQGPPFRGGSGTFSSQGNFNRSPSGGIHPLLMQGSAGIPHTGGELSSKGIHPALIPSIDVAPGSAPAPGGISPSAGSGMMPPMSSHQQGGMVNRSSGSGGEYMPSHLLNQSVPCQGSLPPSANPMQPLNMDISASTAGGMGSYPQYGSAMHSRGSSPHGSFQAPGGFPSHPPQQPAGIPTTARGPSPFRGQSPLNSQQNLGGGSPIGALAPGPSMTRESSLTSERSLQQSGLLPAAGLGCGGGAQIRSGVSPLRSGGLPPRLPPSSSALPSGACAGGGSTSPLSAHGSGLSPQRGPNSPMGSQAFPQQQTGPLSMAPGSYGGGGQDPVSPLLSHRSSQGSRGSSPQARVPGTGMPGSSSMHMQPPGYNAAQSMPPGSIPRSYSQGSGFSQHQPWSSMPPQFRPPN